MRTDNSDEISLQAAAMLFDEPLMVVPEPVLNGEPNAVTFSGQNTNGLVLVVSGADVFAAAEQQLLADIITKGLKFEQEDCATVRWDGSVTWNKLKTTVTVRHLILFGILPENFGINRSAAIKYVPFNLEDSTVIWADALHQLGADMSLKKKFWAALQTILK